MNLRRRRTLFFLVKTLKNGLLNSSDLIIGVSQRSCLCCLFISLFSADLHMEPVILSITALAHIPLGLDLIAFEAKISLAEMN